MLKEFRRFMQNAVLGTDYHWPDIFGSPDRDQVAVVYDLLSEGEIEGLADGLSSVYLNDTPLMKGGMTEKMKGRSTYKANTTASSTTVTVDSSDSFFDGITTEDLSEYGNRFIDIKGAGKSTASTAAAGSEVTFSLEAGRNILTASGDFFIPAMVTTKIGGQKQKIVIQGAGPGGTELECEMLQYKSPRKMQLTLSLPNPYNDFIVPDGRTTVNGASAAITHRAQLVSIDAANDSCVISSAAVTACTNTYAVLGPPYTDIYSGLATYTTSTKESIMNFDNTGLSFRSGTVNQTPIPDITGGQLPSQVWMLASGQEVKQTGNGEEGGLAYWATNAGALSGTATPRASDKYINGDVGTSSPITITSGNVDVSDASIVDKIKLTFEFPGGLICHDRDDGEKGPGWVEFQIWFEYQPAAGDDFISELMYGRHKIHDRDGVSQDVNFFGGTDAKAPYQASDAMIIAKTQIAFAEEFLLDVQEFKPFHDWKVVIKKVNEDNWDTMGDWLFQDDVFLKTVEAMTMDRLSYPQSAYAMITFNAKDFKNPPQRQYHLKGMKVQIPTNYVTRDNLVGNPNGVATYTRNSTSGINTNTPQTWDGNMQGDWSTFTDPTDVNYERVYCNNPAWIFYDICTNKRYGLGTVVKDNSFINKFQLYKIAQYCDELVPDGKGGKEPRFVLNTYLANGTEAYTVLSQLAASFRAMTYWKDSQIQVIQDSPKVPLYTFTNSNVAGGVFGYQSTADRLRPNQIVVSWNNPDNSYEQTVEVVEDVDNIIERGEIITEEIAAYGCTSQGQAHRLGQWNILTNKYETEVVSFSTGMNALFLKPGDLINVQDKERNSIDFSGRISKEGTVNTNTISLDREVSFYPESTYTLHLIFPGGGAYIVSEVPAIDGGYYHTIEGTKYYKGDYVPTLKGVDLNSEAVVAKTSITDDAGNIVQIHWSGQARVEKQIINISQSGTADSNGIITTSRLDTFGAFSGVPSTEVIWAISSDEISEQESAGRYTTKIYRVLSIEEDTDSQEYTISASYYNPDKYDLLEKGYKIYSPITDRLPDKDKSLSSPTDIRCNIERTSPQVGISDQNTGIGWRARIDWNAPMTATVVSYTDYERGSRLNEDLDKIDETISVESGAIFDPSGGVIKIHNEFITYTGVSTNDLTGCERGAYDTVPSKHRQIEWSPGPRPKGGFRANGTPTVVYPAIEIAVPDIIKYEIRHNLIGSKEIYESVSGNTTSHQVDSIAPGYKKIAVRCINIDNKKSNWKEIEQYVVTTTPSPFGRINKLKRGGHMTGNFVLNTTTGNVNTAADKYTFTSVKGEQFTYGPGASTAQEIQVFSGLSSSDGVGYLIHDASNTTDPWIAGDIYTDYVVSLPTGVSTTLTEDLTDEETAIDIASGTSFSYTGSITVGTEEIHYESKSAVTGACTLQSCTRGFNNTTAAEHSNGASVHSGFLKHTWWKEIGASNKGLTLLDGTVTIVANTNKITGTNTEFLTDGLKTGDFIRISNTNDYALETGATYHEVARVESELELYTIETIRRAFSAKYLYYQSWKPDFEKDTVCAKITRTS